MTVRNLLETGALGKLSIYQSQFSRYRPEVQSERWREQELPDPASCMTWARI